MSLNPLSKKVSIVNPMPGGSAYTSRKRAMRFVHHGQAVFVGPNEIRLIEDGHQCRSAFTSAMLPAAGSRATYDEIKHLPVAGRDSVQLITANRRTPARTAGQQRAAVHVRSYRRLMSRIIPVEATR